MGVVFDGVVWLGLAMIWAWLVGVASVLELVFKKLEPMTAPNFIANCTMSIASSMVDLRTKPIMVTKRRNVKQLL